MQERYSINQKQNKITILNTYSYTYNTDNNEEAVPATCHSVTNNNEELCTFKSVHAYE